jgi:hypothetical protein
VGFLLAAGHRLPGPGDLGGLAHLCLGEHGQHDDPPPRGDPVGDPGALGAAVEPQLPQLPGQLAGVGLAQQHAAFFQQVQMEHRLRPPLVIQPLQPVPDFGFEFRLAPGHTSDDIAWRGCGARRATRIVGPGPHPGSMGRSRRRPGPRVKYVQPGYRHRAPAAPPGPEQRVSRLSPPQVLERIRRALLARDEAEAELAVLIDHAVGLGIGWPDIAARLGVSRQAARQQYQRRHCDKGTRQDYAA